MEKPKPSIRNQPKSELSRALKRNEPISSFDKRLCDHYVMKRMRECFGEKWYNTEKLFPDPRQEEPKPVRKLRRD